MLPSSSRPTILKTAILKTAILRNMILKNMILTNIAAAVLLAAASHASAAPINGGVEAPTPDVFYNFYVPPVPAGAYPGVGAQLYVAPRPVPPRVGHTWYTYPPFMPHEFLYKHRRHYVRPAGAMGMRTDVHAYWW